MKLAIYLLFLLSTVVYAENPILKIGVIDTGLDLNDDRINLHLCKSGHTDFTSTGIRDIVGHGTHVAGLIEKYAGESENYCLIVYKYYLEKDRNTNKNDEREILALQKAIRDGVNIVNFSSGGKNYDENERRIIEENPNITFVVSAGNNGLNIDKIGGSFYPASLSLDNIQVVGNLGLDGKKAPSSNWASRAINWEVGEKVYSTLPNGFYGYMAGTSQAAAIFTGKLVRKLLNAN
jgi:hypothetical protein